jgi:thiamine biosynthesis lipoprotein
MCSDRIRGDESTAWPARAGPGRVMAIVVSLLGLVACAAAPRNGTRGPVAGPGQRLVSERVLMGTTFRIVLHAESTAQPADSARAEEALEAAFAAIAEVERWASDWEPTSEVREVAARAEVAPPGAAVSVSSELAEHLAFALDIAARTGGAFDPTLGTLTRLWRRSARLGELPSPARLAEARAAAGYERVELDIARREVRIRAPGLRFDLGGSAKGEGLDRALAALRARGFERALVDGGGDVLVGAPPPGELGWRIEVRPLGPEGPRHCFTAAHCAIATSGDSQQRVELDGVSYAHIVDPATGLGVTARRAATVVAPDARAADALATALVVRGEAGLVLLAKSPRVEGALFEGTAQGGDFPACATAGFPHDGGHAAGVPGAAMQHR